MKNISKIFMLCLLFALSSCSTKVWVPENTGREIASINDPSILKTDWGYMKITYSSVSRKDGISFQVEIVNESKKPIIYDRSFVKVIDEKGQEYFDLQKKWTNEIVDKKEQGQESNWRFLSPTYLADKKNNPLEMRTIEPKESFKDELFFDSSVANENNALTFVFGPELIKNEQLNSLRFVAVFP